ncbi:Rhodanese-like domain-containing protein 4A, chloroplastic, partial [Linum perenne]
KSVESIHLIPPQSRIQCPLFFFPAAIMKPLLLSSSSSSSPPLLKIHNPKPPKFPKLPSNHVNYLFRNLSLPLSSVHLLSSIPPCLASEPLIPSPAEYSDKINLESVLVSIDDFFTANPFFVSGCLFVWLVVIPFGQRYLRGYRFLSAINAFRKLRDDPKVQLLDIRDDESVASLCSPNLKIFDKRVERVEFDKGDEDGFVKKVLGVFPDTQNTILCVLDKQVCVTIWDSSVDDNSLQVAELLVKNGFKGAYAVKGGVRGKKGWVAIQKTMLPPSVRMLRNKAKISEPGSKGGTLEENDVDNSVDAASATSTR